MPMNTLHKTLLAAIHLTAGLMFAPLTLIAAENLASGAPPPNQEEAMPPAHLGQIWDAGHWDWNGHEYVWRRGSWRDAKPGFHWVADRWEQSGTQWRHVQGHWEH
jgi:hypothetical protein